MKFTHLSDGELAELAARIDAELTRRAILASEPAGAELVVTTQGCFRCEFVRCGKSRCRCSSTSYRHGPYWYRYYRRAGRLVSKYVGKKLPNSVQLEFDVDQQKR